MKAEITARNLYYNPSLLNYFFRTQSQNDFNTLFECVEESESEIFDSLDNYSDDLDEVEEMFYNDSIQEIAYTLNLTLIEEEEN